MASGPSAASVLWLTLVSVTSETSEGAKTARTAMPTLKRTGVRTTKVRLARVASEVRAPRDHPLFDRHRLVTKAELLPLRIDTG